MADPEHDAEWPLPHSSHDDRMARLRAVGREMEFRALFVTAKKEWTAKERQYREELDRVKRDAERQLQDLQRELEQTQRLLAETSSQLADEKAQREEVIRQLDRERRDAAERERELNAQLENHRLQLQMLMNSRSWKITRPLRAVTGLLKSGPKDGTSKLPETPEEAPPVVEAPPALEETTADNGALPSAIDLAAEAVTAETEGIPAEDVELKLEPEAQAVMPEQKSREPSERPFFICGRDAWDQAGTARLQELLSSDRRLSLERREEPALSIVMVLFNQAHLTLLCLESLLQHGGDGYELILVDNHSTDRTGELLERLDGAKIIRNTENQGFGRGCMQGVQHAIGKYLCFLNNDVILCPGTLSTAIATFEQDPNIGAVGGKLLLSDGRLQEAGSIVWSDGTSWGYGREDDASSPKYSFRRPVDYCSGALLFTPRQVFTEAGGFDQRFSPAYYEDTDYCFKLWDRGLTVLYEPGCEIHHYESASMNTDAASKSLIASHKLKFVEKWKDRLSRQLPLRGEFIPYARAAVQGSGARILYLTTTVPRAHLGPEFARANQFLRQLAGKGHCVTCVSTSDQFGADEYVDLPRQIELADAEAQTHYVFRELLSQYDVAWIAGPESMQEFLRHLWNIECRVPPIIYEPGASATRQDHGISVPQFDTGGGISLDADLVLCQSADLVVVESAEAQTELRDHSVRAVELLSDELVDRILAQAARENRQRLFEEPGPGL